MHSLILAVALASPEPAALKVEVDASHFTDWAVFYNGKNFDPLKTIIVTRPFYGQKTLNIEVKWVAGDRVIRQTFSITLRSGYVTTVRIRIPRVWTRTVLV